MTEQTQQEDLVMESNLEFYNAMKILVEQMEADVLKSTKGNKAAGVRLRKSLRQLKSHTGDFVKFTLSKD